MNFVNSIKTCFNKYVDFTGRASRSEYWWFALFVFILLLASTFIHPYLYWLLVLFLFLPHLAVNVRRLHDIDRTGWWVLILLIPLIGPIIMLIFLVTKGTEGPNRFGMSPIMPAIK